MMPRIDVKHPDDLKMWRVGVRYPGEATLYSKRMTKAEAEEVLQGLTPKLLASNDFCYESRLVRFECDMGLVYWINRLTIAYAFITKEVERP